MFKSELRKTYLAKMKALSQKERLEISEQISRQFFDNFSLEKVKCLHVFLPILKNNEIETKFIYEKIWRDFPNIKLVVPRVKGEEIESIEFNLDSDISLSKWEIPEPISGKIIEPKEIDLVIVPLLAFDEKGFRVGYGKGFYDRLLSKCREDCLKIGVSFFEPISEIIDKNKNDVRLKYCLTPFTIRRF